MNEYTISSISQAFESSNEGSIHFGEAIAQLINAGVESYHVDYRSARTTYYLSDESTLDFSFELPKQGISKVFDVQALRATILRSQQGHVMYPEFKRLSQLAGCASYTVWITGRCVVYMGRQGEMHIERFPD